jgi:transposase InsO family protein
MSPRPPLTQHEKERIYQGKLAGRKLADLAQVVGCSYECARKWWRVGRKHGEAGLRASRAHRGKTGALSQFDPVLVTETLRLKKAHPGWGADRVRVELAQTQGLSELALPSRSRLAAFFKERCPECLARHQPRLPAPSRPLPASGVQEVWQVDSQENIRLQDGTIATICSVRDPVGAAMIASQAFSVQTRRHWRKLTWTEIRGVLRQGFAEWGTLPEVVLTDNELVQAGNPQDRFPARLTLWLVGLGIQHRFIRPGCPTDQPQVERNHRTLANWTQDASGLASLVDLQQALDRERVQYNQYFPALASDCQRQPPLLAHPQLLEPRRPYSLEQELAIFDLQRVFDFLAVFRFRRKVQQTTAHISLDDRSYCLSRWRLRHYHLKTVQVQMDPQAHQWVVFTDEDHPEELMRLAPRNLDVPNLTGLEPGPNSFAQPIQLFLPFWMPEPGVRLL